MHHTRRPVVNPLLVIVAALAFLATYQSFTSHAAAPAPTAPMNTPTVVVTLDLERAMNTIDVNSERLAKLKAKASELEAQRQEKVKQANEAEEVLDLLPKGTPKYDEAEKKAVHLAFEAKALLGFGKEKLDEMQGESFRKLYEDVKQGLATYSGDRGYDLVLLNDCVRELDSGGARDVNAQISARRMLYFNKAIDITDDFITWMNNRAKVAAGG